MNILKSSLIKFIGPAGLIILATVLVYAGSLGNDFVWDDTYLIVDNDFTHSLDNLPLLFSPEYLTSIPDLDRIGIQQVGSGELSYRPVCTFSFFTDYFLWELNPFGFHLTNLVLHCLNGILLFWFAWLLMRNRFYAMLAALVFCLHPVNAEAAAIISFREDLLVMFFWMICLIIHAVQDKFRGWKLGLIKTTAVLSFLLSLFSKEMAITLPGILLIYDWCFRLREHRGTAFFKKLDKPFYAAYAAAALFFLWVWFFPMARPMDLLTDYFDGNVIARILTMTKVVGIYLWWLIVPLNIHSTILDVSIITSSIKDIRVLASLGALIIIFIYTIKIRRASPVRFFAIAWFFLTLLPVLNILLMPNIYASRFLYIPSIGFSLFFASAWKSLTGTMRRHFHPAPLTRLPGLFLAGILCSYGILTHLSCYTWKNDTIFYYSIVQSYPRHPSAYAGMGDILHRQGLLHEAEQSFLTAVMLDPNYHEAYNSLGRVYIDQNRIDQAVEQFQKSTAINPGYATARINLCAAYGAGGDHNRAVACLEAFNADHPYDARAYHNLIVSYYHIGDHDKAAALLEQIPDARRASH